jgi:hypothetical protein
MAVPAIPPLPLAGCGNPIFGVAGAAEYKVTVHQKYPERMLRVIPGRYFTFN